MPKAPEGTDLTARRSAATQPPTPRTTERPSGVCRGQDPTRRRLGPTVPAPTQRGLNGSRIARVSQPTTRPRPTWAERLTYSVGFLSPRRAARTHVAAALAPRV